MLLQNKVSKMKHHLIWMGIKGLSLSEEEKTGIQKYGVSGLILFKRNIESLSQLFELCREIKSLNPAPLIMMDREGGLVDRLRYLPDFPPWPEPAWLAHHCSLEKIQQTAFHIACEMKALGICLNFAPVVDVPSVKSTVLEGRVWGDSPKEVSQKALAWMRGFSQAGIGSCVKHFPGHGGVSEDSHFKLPIDNRDLETLEKYDLIPFQKAIEAGVSAVMTAHVAYMSIEVSAAYGGDNQPDIISPLPATFSPHLLKKVLRGQMGFSGLVVSDDLDMKAVSVTNDSESTIMNHVLCSGVDIVLKCEPPQDLLAFLEKAFSGYKYRIVEPQEVDKKIDRLRQFQQKYASIQPVAQFKELKQVLATARKGYENLVSS